MAYTDASYKFAGAGSYSLNYVETSDGTRTSDIESYSVTGWSYSDFTQGVTVTLGSASRTTDGVKGTDELKISSLSVKTPEITMTTASATLRASDAIPDLDFGFGPGSSIEGLGDAVIASLSETLWNFDNVVTVNSADGLSVYAGAGNDTVTGGRGADRISGGKGRDTLTGGLGADTFVISGSDLIAADADTFVDFNIAQGDRIEFDGDTGIGFSLDNFELGSGANSTTGANLIYSGGSLYFDSDGVGGNSGVLIATIGSRPTFKTKDEYAALFGG
jgi:Ca2+-binding RTX toxin-like protein